MGMRQRLWNGALRVKISYLCNMKKIPDLSIIIATYNRAAGLVRTLDSLAGQTLAPALWEIVAVNNNSTDDTEARFAAWQAAHPALNARMVFEGKQGLSHARNCGIGASQGEYIVIIDDDELVNTRFCEAYHTFFQANTPVAAAGGRIVPLYEFPPPVWLTKYTERPIAGTLDLGEQCIPFPGQKFPGGGNMAVRRSILKKYDAFHPALGRTGNTPLSGEEKELFLRLRRADEKIYYIPDAIIYHVIPLSRFEPAYFARLTRMSGVSERRRTLQHSRFAYLTRLLGEAVRWAATLALACLYLLRGIPSKGKWLIRMRWNITCGLLLGR